VAWLQPQMRASADQNGKIVVLDDCYDSITCSEPRAPGQQIADSRHSVPVDLDRRP
jgi:hypothetical protein